jgi:hypothetical protein
MNMTVRANDQRLEHTERKMALKFLLHLIGDLHCPLHAEGLLRGGNDIFVVWKGEDTNLHFVWDVLIPQTMTNSTEAEERVAAAAWAEQLWNKTLESFDSTVSMVRGSVNTVDEILGYGNNAEKSILRWATEANAWVCRTVLRDGVDGVKGQELSSKYYIEAISGIEELVTNAGFRLAAWINELARQEASKSNGNEYGELKLL